MLKQFKYKNVTWLDLESPTELEIQQIGEDYKVHPVVLHELASKSERSKVDVYNDFIYLVLHFPSPHGRQEIDFVIGENFIITTHYELVNSLNDFAKIFETDFSLKRHHDKIHAGYIFYYIVKEIYANLETGLDLINKRLRDAEEKVFSGHEREMVEALASLNHELLDYQWTMKSHHEILASLQTAGEEFFGTKFRYYLQAMSGEDRKIWKMIESNREAFNDLRSTNESLLSVKTNETMKVLTVVAFIFLPLNLVAQIYGESKTTFVLMIILLVAAIWTAKSKKWL